MIFRQMMIGTAAAAMMVASTGIAAADTWRYAFEEALDAILRSMGLVAVESEEGKGSKFTITLPIGNEKF